jgi:hypothetical protein
MKREINAAKEQVINILKELQSKYPTILLLILILEQYLIEIK